MKKLFTALFCSALAGSMFGQWSPTTNEGGLKRSSDVRSYYKLDLNKIRTQLNDAQEMGKSAKPVEISLPTLDGKIERFAIYSFPVVVKEIADQYQLGSYVGVGIDDPSKNVRFSVAPNDFQSMIEKHGVYEFIEPLNSAKTVYGVHPKTHYTQGQGFLCSMNENVLSKKQLDKLYKGGKSFTNSSSDFSKMSDKKYRTMRLAMSVTAEYTTFHGGTVAGALTAINATMTRVNGVFEKDFALHLNVQNFPAVIYTNASTDPYSAAGPGANGAWNLELQNTLTNIVGDTNYDIGHLFGASGGGGNAGCIGCVCINPTTAEPEGKGSGYTSPADAIPQGDNFDIDYVAHEMGHQLGANHTFSQAIEGTGVNMEPGSGSTIMGYAGITSANVQNHSDAYFHVASIFQVEDNLVDKTCDVETTLVNSPPVIAPFTDYSIPKGTAFVLTASATDPQGDPMTYTWEQFDSAATPVTTVTGNNVSGALFRSLPPSTSPTRYFPKLASVLNGNLTVPADWETVSNVARETIFAVTVRDNNPISTAQQTQSDGIVLTVGNDGPFKINTTQVYHNVSPSPVVWDVVNTNVAPYNVSNVKIDYTINNGTTWTVLSASTPNDGTESFAFPSTLNGQNIKLRVSSIGNVFYAVKQILVTAAANCDGSAPTNVVVSTITSASASVSWNTILNATFQIRYRKINDPAWITVTSTSNSVTLTGLEEGSKYEVQVAAVCTGTVGTYSSSSQFVTASSVVYCALTSSDPSDEFISNVTLANLNNTTGPATYTDYGTDFSKIVNLNANSTNNQLSVTKAWSSDIYAEGVGVWIDFNRNGTFEASEMVMNSPVSVTTPVTATFAVPSTAVLNKTLKMRVAMRYNAIPAACTSFTYGEVEDYNVIVTTALSTNNAISTNHNIQIYPNPATDVLNITNVSDKATYKIYSAVGQLINNGNINAGKINVSTLIKGAYVITIEDKGKDAIRSKFLKK